MFDTYCVPCHGATGEGDGLVVQHGFPAPPTLVAGADSRDERRRRSSASSPTDPAAMPSYAAQIARDDRWKAILHLRTAAEPHPPPASGRRNETRLPVRSSLPATTRTIIHGAGGHRRDHRGRRRLHGADAHVGELADGGVLHARARAGGAVLRRHSLRDRLDLERRVPARPRSAGRNAALFDRHAGHPVHRASAAVWLDHRRELGRHRGRWRSSTSGCRGRFF